MRYSGDHKAKTRERVLREAAREIRAKGRENVAVAKVMERAGLTHGGFYAHFESKDAMIAEAVDSMFLSARGRFDAIEEANSDPRETLRIYLDFYLSQAHRDGRDRGCALPALSGDFARAEDPGQRARFGAGVEALTTRPIARTRPVASVIPRMYETFSSSVVNPSPGASVVCTAMPHAESSRVAA